MVNLVDYKFREMDRKSKIFCIAMILLSACCIGTGTARQTANIWLGPDITKYYGVQSNAKSVSFASSENVHILSDLRQNRINEQKRFLVIPVEFKDVRFTISQVKTHLEEFLNSENYSYDGATGSVASYFNDNFAGKCSFVFDVADIVTLDKELAYYGAQTSLYVDANVEEMVLSACAAASAAGVDFAKYDNDGDGYADNVSIIFAGVDQTQSSVTDAIWAQRGSVSAKNVFYDGVRIGSFICTPEYDCNATTGERSPAAIGLFCHELAHVLGLPDIYDLNGEEEGLSNAMYGSLSIMDKGAYLNSGKTPPYFNALEREILEIGVVEDIVAGRKYVLGGIEEGGPLYRIPLANEGEYFLVECRNNAKWDRYCEGNGLVVYHIDKSENNSGGLSAVRRWELNILNCHAEHQCARALFPPGENSFKELGYNSRYPLRDWAGHPVGIKLSDISYDGKVLSFTAEEDVKWDSSIASVLEAKVTPFENDAHLEWGFSSAADTAGGFTNIYWHDTENGESGYAKVRGTDFLIPDLAPGCGYNVELFFEKGGQAGNVCNTEFVTETADSPYPYLCVKGEYRTGERLYLRVLNMSEEPSSIRYVLNGQEQDGDFILFASRGTYILEAIIEYDDTTCDIIRKIVTVKDRVQ